MQRTNMWCVWFTLNMQKYFTLLNWYDTWVMSMRNHMKIVFIEENVCFYIVYEIYYLNRTRKTKHKKWMYPMQHCCQKDEINLNWNRPPSPPKMGYIYILQPINTKNHQLLQTNEIKHSSTSNKYNTSTTNRQTSQHKSQWNIPTQMQYMQQCIHRTIWQSDNNMTQRTHPLPKK